MLTRQAPISILSPTFDLRQCSWFRPRTVSVLNTPDTGDGVQQQLLPKLLDALRAQGHSVFDHPVGTVNLMLAFQPTLEAPHRWRDWAAPRGPKRAELGDKSIGDFFAFVNCDLSRPRPPT